MNIRSKQRGAKVSIYFRGDVHQRLASLVEQGAYASEVVDKCMRASLPTVEREMERQLAAEKKPTTNQTNRS